MVTTLLELTGRVNALSAPRQALKKLWSRDLLLAVEGGSQPGEGLVKIQFSGERLSLLDAVQVGDRTTVAFLIRGVEYEWEGVTKHLIVLVGQHLWLHPAAPRRVAEAVVLPVEAAEYDAVDVEAITDEAGFQPQTLRLGSRMAPPSGGRPASPASHGAPSGQPRKQPAKKKNAGPTSFPKSNSFEEPPF